MLQSSGLEDIAEDATKRFLRSTAFMGNNLLIITAGLNMVLNLRQSPRGPAHAQEVLGFISKSAQY